MSTWAGIDEFFAVAQARSFTAAARRLGRSTSKLSRDVAELEERLGQVLFYRTTRHVSLTEAGERFLGRCRHLLEERDEAIASMLEEADDVRGVLRMTCAVAYGEQLIVPIINRLLARHPGLSVEILLTNDVVDLVDAGLDLAVRTGRLQDSRLIATRLASRTRHLCASPSYLGKHGEPATLEDLARHVCLRGTADLWTFRRGGQSHSYRPSGRFHCNSGYATLQAALDGLGLCQLPDFYVERHLASGDLVEVLTAFRPEDEGVWAVYPDRRRLPMKVRLVVAELQSGLTARAARRGRPAASGQALGTTR